MTEQNIDNRIEPTACRCILCGSGKNLSMYAYRVAGYIVGWVVACQNCRDGVTELSITIT